MKKTVISLVLAVLLLAGCVPVNMDTTAPDSSGATVAVGGKTQAVLEQIAALGESPDDNYRVWYEIFVYSYCDSDGDGIGDLNGVRSKLPELEALGITGIWLMPIHPSTTYHKYNVSDYYAIDPTYGTMEDFDALLEDCEQLGIKVILDLVVNHTGSEHPWFQQAVAYLQSLPQGQKPKVEDCPYLDYYTFVPAKEAVGGYSPVNGTDYSYLSVFSYDMPDLNLHNPDLRQQIEKIMAFWMDKGVAGFRLDAVKEFFSGSTDKNVEVLSWLRQAATAIDPNAYLVAEVWDTFAAVTDYYESGITSIFNYPFGDATGKITKVLQGIGNSSVVSTYATALEKADKAYLAANPDYIDAPFLSNHDVGRIAGFAGRNEVKMKLAATMNLFMGGSVFVYYGEEIGMPGSGNDPSKRAPMYWNAARNDGTTDPPPDCVLPAEYPLGSLEEQREDDSSLYNYYRQAIAIRKALPVISHGRTTAESNLNKGCVSAQRKTWGEESCLILMNIDTQETQVDLTGYEDWKLAASLSADGGEVVCGENTMKLPPCGVVVLIPKQEGGNFNAGAN